MTDQDSELPAHHRLLDQMADAVYLLDPETSNIIWCNRAAYEDLGLDADEVLHHSVLSLQKDVTGLPQWSEIAEVIRGTPYYTFVGRHRHKDGGEVPVEVNTTRFFDQGREYFLSVARNIGKRMALEQQLNARNAQLWFALNEAMDGMWDWDLATNHVFFSPQLKRMLGYGPEEMPPQVETWTENIHPEDRDHVLFRMQEHLRGRRMHYEAEYRLRNRNGHFIWVHDRGKVCERDAEGNPTRMVGMVQNITDRKLLEARLESQAHVDELTRLPNRRAGQQQLDRLVAPTGRTPAPLCLGIVDIDHFKLINDLYGHARGDQVLELVATALRDSLRRSDHVFRWGGEEFLLILPDTSREECEAVASKLHERIADLDWAKLGMPPVTFSIGVACQTGTPAGMESLLATADAALYRAKNMGRNQTRFAHKASG